VTTDWPPAPSISERLTLVALLADRLHVTDGEARAILPRLSLLGLIRAVPECDLRRLAGLPS
jgi:hypothetical protein